MFSAQGAFLLAIYKKMFESKEVEVKDCSRTTSAIIRHLKNKKYKNSWVLDLFTLRDLIRFISGKQVLLNNDKYREILENFLQKKRYLQFNKLLSDEIKSIKNILEKGENP